MTSINELYRTAAQHSASLARRLEHEWSSAVATGDTEYIDRARAAFDASLTEYNEKKTAGPILSITQIDRQLGRGSYRASARFAVWQGKYRPCDDMKASRINAASVLCETTAMMSQDFAIATSRYFYSLAKADRRTHDCVMVAANEDQSSAYRSAPVREDISWTPQVNVLLRNAMATISV